MTAGEAIENVEGEFGEDDLRADRVTAQAEQAPAEETPPLPVSPGDVSEEKAEELVAEPLPSVNSSARANDSSPSDEDIPSFNEWTLKVLANEEKSGIQFNSKPSLVGLQSRVSGSNGEPAQPPPPKNGKLRQKNYASPDCGAKVILANPEAEHTSAILVPSRDEYFLSPCSAKIWFVIELCEAIQAQRVS